MWLPQQYWKFKSVTLRTRSNLNELKSEGKKILNQILFWARYYSLLLHYTRRSCFLPLPHPPPHNELLLDEVSSPLCINTDCWNNLESLRFCPGSFECQERQNKFFKMVSSNIVKKDNSYSLQKKNSENRINSVSLRSSAHFRINIKPSCF